ncbi:hypothetical protein ACH5RR_001705 [Cinchona calisaya]|uniref:Uncharacterized protein n=1 Tax=Cinchona calisaya TaxID=153742 RepID=A0ABD3B5F9_9GENT
MDVETGEISIPHLSFVLQKWLIAQKHGCKPLPFLITRMLETTQIHKEYRSPCFRTLEEGLQNSISFSFVSQDFSVRPFALEMSSEKSSEDIEVAVGKLSLISISGSLDVQSSDPLLPLLTACGQSAPSALLDVGKGTDGEAFKLGEIVCKIIPFDGDIQVNGKVQKCNVVFVQEQGGQDLGSFMLHNFDEARSLLVQVTFVLAVAETVFEFEHLDLDWSCCHAFELV